MTSFMSALLDILRSADGLHVDLHLPCDSPQLSGRHSQEPRIKVQDTTATTTAAAATA